MKSIIFAGGSGGLGAAAVRLAAQKGFRPVIGCLKNRERADALAAEVDGAVIAGNILEAGTRARLLDAAARIGEPYGLVVLAGEPARTPIETASVEDLTASMQSNFTGPILLARDFAAAAGDRDGSIVFLSTMQAVAIFPGSAVYAAPKAALIHAARILARQWKLRVNVVAPGVNEAGMAEHSVRSGKYAPFLEKGIAPRYGRPEDVARAILFFLEPDNYVTGQVLTVDGGLTLKM